MVWIKFEVVSDYNGINTINKSSDKENGQIRKYEQENDLQLQGKDACILFLIEMSAQLY